MLKWHSILYNFFLFEQISFVSSSKNQGESSRRSKNSNYVVREPHSSKGLKIKNGSSNDHTVEETRIGDVLEETFPGRTQFKDTVTNIYFSDSDDERVLSPAQRKYNRKERKPRQNMEKKHRKQLTSSHCPRDVSRMFEKCTENDEMEINLFLNEVLKEDSIGNREIHESSNYDLPQLKDEKLDPGINCIIFCLRNCDGFMKFIKDHRTRYSSEFCKQLFNLFNFICIY